MDEEEHGSGSPVDHAMDFCAAKGCKWCILFVFAFFFHIGVTVLMWNEYRYVKFDNSLNYITENVHEAGCEADPELNGKLVHVSCPVTHLPDLSESPGLELFHPLFVDKEIQGSDLIWTAEAYQWVSHTETYGRRRTQEQTVWTKKWKGIDAGEWHRGNPIHPPSNAKSGSAVGNPRAIWIGDKDAPMKGYHLSRYLRQQILRLDFALVLRQDVKAKERYPSSGSEEYGKDLKPDNFYTCGHMLSTLPCDEEAIGAIRIAFQLVAPHHVSILAMQRAPPSEFVEHDSRRLVEYTVKDFTHGYGEGGGARVGVPEVVKQAPPTKLEDFDIPLAFIKASYDAEFLYDGNVSITDMLGKLAEENTVVLWCWRFAGWLLLCVPTWLLLQAGPIIVVETAGFMIDDLTGGYTSVAGCICAFMAVMSLILTIPVTFIIIGIAWVLVRPVIGLCLMVPSVIVLCLLYYPLKRALQRKKERDVEMDNLLREETQPSSYF